MGWSVDTVRPELNKIFKEADRRYRITHPQSAHVGVIIQHLGKEDLPVRFKKQIANLFPEFVYIDFVLVQESQVVAEQMEWDNQVQEAQVEAQPVAEQAEWNELVQEAQIALGQTESNS